jgi:hypothetical protein
MMSHFRKPAKAAAASGKQQAGGQKPPDPNAADISGALAGLQELSSAAAAMQSMHQKRSAQFSPFGFFFSDIEL